MLQSCWITGQDHHSQLNEPGFCTEMTKPRIVGLQIGSGQNYKCQRLCARRYWEYHIPKHVRSYEAELQSRTQNGWLLPHPEEKLGPPNGCDLIQHNPPSKSSSLITSPEAFNLTMLDFFFTLLYHLYLLKISTTCLVPNAERIPTENKNKIIFILL